MAITDLQMRRKPTDEDQWFRQPFGRGGGVFEARITPAGERRFYFRAVDSKGSRYRLLIGGYDGRGVSGFTVAGAYAEAAKLSRLYQDGVRDLREHFAQAKADLEAAQVLERNRQATAQIEAEAARQAAEAEKARRLSVRQLFKRYQETALQPRVLGDGKRVGRKDGGEALRVLFEQRLFPVLGDRAAADVRKADLMVVIDQAKADGRLRTANVLLSTIRGMFRFAMAREIVDRNPLDGIERKDAGGPNVRRTRHLNDEEIKQLVRRLPAAGLEPSSAIAVWLLLATGCRVSELLTARWDQVDLAAKTIYLPETKNQRDHTVHLNVIAVEKIKELAALRKVQLAARRKKERSAKPSEWMFHNAKGDGPVSTPSLGKQISDRQRSAESRLAKRSSAVGGLSLTGGRWTAHDLRRTMATQMAGLGVHAYTIEECLNHLLPGVAGIYVQDRRLAEQARAFDAWGVKLKSLRDGKAMPSNIVALASA